MNAELATAPEKINKDAHSAWMIKITLNDPAELNSLLSAADYENSSLKRAGSDPSRPLNNRTAPRDI